MSPSPGPGTLTRGRSGIRVGNETLRGLLLATAGVAVLSPDSLLVRLIDASDWTLIFWRGVLLGATLGLFTLARYGPQALARARAVGRAGVIAAVLFAGSTILFVLSIRLTAVANTLVIIAAAPLFAAILSRVVLRERQPARTWACVLVVLGGVLLIFYGSIGESSLLGDLCAVGTAICVSANLVTIRRARGVDMIPSVTLSGFIVAVGVSPLATPLAPSAHAFALLLVLGVLVLPVSFGLITVAPRLLPAPEVSLIMLLEAVLGPLWVWLALGEVPDKATFFGGALILVTLAAHSLLRLRGHRRAARRFRTRDRNLA